MECFWVVVDGMGGDYVLGLILEGCLDVIDWLLLKICFVGEIDWVMVVVNSFGLCEVLESVCVVGYMDLVVSGFFIGMDDEVIVVWCKWDVSINVVMDLVKKGEVGVVYFVGNFGVVMVLVIF